MAAARLLACTAAVVLIAMTGSGSAAQGGIGFLNGQRLAKETAPFQDSSGHTRTADVADFTFRARGAVDAGKSEHAAVRRGKRMFTRRQRQGHPPYPIAVVRAGNGDYWCGVLVPHEHQVSGRQTGFATVQRTNARLKDYLEPGNSHHWT